MRPLQQYLVLFFAFFVLKNNLANGQAAYVPTLQPGAKWEIEIGAGMNNYNYGYLLVTCDSMEINEKFYTVVKGSSYTGWNECGTVAYLREDPLERKIYYLPEADENLEELLLMDYALEKGDTFFFHNGWGEQVVDTIRYIEFLGQTVKFIDFGCLPCDGLIEGFGFYSSGPSINCEGYSTISGYEVLDCDEVNDIERAQTLESMKVYPNPAGNQLTIELNDPGMNYPIHIELRSLTGALLVEQTMFSSQTALNLDGLPKGVLLLVLKGEGFIAAIKVIHY